MSAAEDFAEPIEPEPDEWADVPHRLVSKAIRDLDPYHREMAVWDLIRRVDEEQAGQLAHDLARAHPKAFVKARHGSAGEAVAIEEEVARLRIRDTARQRYAAEQFPDDALPSLLSLTDLLAESDEDVRYLVDGLWPVDGKIVLAAQNKSGKTTLIGNLVRSLVDGTPFLDTYRVAPVSRIVLLDNELSKGMVRRWLRDQGIDNTDAVQVVPMRGRLSAFNILDPDTRAKWAERIGPADVLIFDPLRPALDSLALSEDKDSGRFLEALDELVATAGIGQLAVVHHMGHSGERSRGDSRIEDWPDAKWKLVKMDPADGTEENYWPRFFSAFGRDVDQEEVQLRFNPLDRHLDVKPGGGNRKAAKQSALAQAILDYVTLYPGCSQGKIEASVTGDDKTIRREISRMEDQGVLRIEPGPNRTKQHYVVDDRIPLATENVENS